MTAPSGRIDPASGWADARAAGTGTRLRRRTRLKPPDATLLRTQPPNAEVNAGHQRHQGDPGRDQPRAGITRSGKRTVMTPRTTRVRGNAALPPSGLQVRGVAVQSAVPRTVVCPFVPRPVTGRRVPLRVRRRRRRSCWSRSDSRVDNDMLVGDRNPPASEQRACGAGHPVQRACGVLPIERDVGAQADAGPPWPAHVHVGRRCGAARLRGRHAGVVPPATTAA